MDTEWIGHETVGAALVGEGVEVELDLIVLELNVLLTGWADVFTTGHAGADPGRVLVEANEYCVEILRVVAEVDVGFLLGRSAVFWIALDEVIDLGHGRG